MKPIHPKIPNAIKRHANIIIKGVFIPYAVLLCFCGIGFLSPIEVKKPNLVGKICLIIVGLAEAFGIFFVGWKLA